MMLSGFPPGIFGSNHGAIGKANWPGDWFPGDHSGVKWSIGPQIILYVYPYWYSNKKFISIWGQLYHDITTCMMYEKQLI